MKATLLNPCVPRSRSNSQALALILVALLAGGCQSPQQFSDVPEKGARVPESILLREGDTVRVTFPGSPTLNTSSQQIRRDGNITLPLIGEFKAVGLTPAELEKQLVKLYAPQLVTKEVTVTVESSSYPVFVTGAVLRPGKIICDRPITALEAVMDAGVDYSKANLKAVTVIRNEKGRNTSYTLNLKRVLNGEDAQPFVLKPSDIVYVKEKFSWF